tara:strand:- start:78 stop:563 length:486 start_codon:yes stop_codon:yes gene_type:complete
MKVEKIKYGRFENIMWNSLKGISSVQHVIDRIYMETPIENYKLFAHGMILNDQSTYDLDLTLVGPLDAKVINSILDGIVRIGFEEQIYCDVKYSVTGDLYDPVVDTTKTIRYACYRPSITIDDRTYTYAEEVQSLYLKDITYPMSKTKNTGLAYKTPIQII